MADIDNYESTQTGTLKGVGDDGQIPKSRLATGSAARSMLAALVDGDNVAAVKRTKLQGMFDGNPMFSDDEVRKANLGFVARANWGGMRAKIKNYLIAYTDILTSTQTLPDVHVTIGDERNRADWGQVFSEEMHRTLFQSYDDWSVIYNMKLHHMQLALHGVGPCFWRDERDWRFYAIKRRNIQVPKESPSDVSRLRVVFVRDWLYVDELYKMANPKFAEDKTVQVAEKWNRDAVIEAMKHTQKRDQQNFTWEVAQEKFKNNAYDWAYTESDVCMIAHAFVKEFDGRVSHHIFAENGIDDYLYSNIGEFEHIGQTVWVCFQDVGNGDFEGVRGLGTEAYHFGALQNRLNNGLAMAAIEAGTRVWQADTTEHANKITKVEIGQDRLIPSGLALQQIDMSGGVNAQLSVAKYFAEVEEGQTGQYKTQASGQTKQPMTAREADIRVGDTSKLTNASVSDYLMQADRLISETFRRLTLENILPTDGGGLAALDFKARCIQRGIPAEGFYELARTAIVNVTRPIGNGSYADRIARMQVIGQHVGDMPVRKRAVYIRDLFAYVTGNREAAERYGPDMEQQFPGIEASLAVLENNGFMAGGSQDPFSPDNAHEVHLPIHLQFAASMLQSGDKQHVAQVMQVLEHHMGEHVQALEHDPTRRAAFDFYAKQLGEMQNDIKKANKMAMLMAAQQRPPEQDPEMIKAQAQITREDALAKAEIVRKNALASQHLAQRDQQAAQQHRIAEETKRAKLNGTEP